MYSTVPYQLFRREFFKLIDVVPYHERSQCNVYQVYCILQTYYRHVTDKYYKSKKLEFYLKDTSCCIYM